ncbi:MAG: hypothetical protein ABI794_14575 [Betaproteobacteria bacterium]
MAAPPGAAQARELLERYVEAKDLNRPELTPALYSRDAVLSFSIATDEISFPDEVRGRQAITRTLVTEFGERFDRCRTFYVCDSLPVHDHCIAFLPWLVVMRETASRTLRVGKGCYRWVFEPDGRPAVRAMKIHIARMAGIADPDGSMLERVQAGLPYPWLAPAELRRVVDALVAGGPAFEFLTTFRETVAPNECGVSN